MAANSVIIGRVGEISGVVHIKLPSGELVQLKEGMMVHADDTIVTANGGSILVYLANGTVFTLGQNSIAQLDEDVMPRADVEELQAKQEDVKDLVQKVLSGQADNLDATAAGQEGGQPQSSSSQNPDQINPDRTQGQVTSGFNTDGSGGDGGNQNNDQAGNNDTNSSKNFFVAQQAGFSVSIDVDRITSDSLVNAQEANGNITVTGQVAGNNIDHGTVTLTLNGNQYAGNFGTDGRYAISVPGTAFVNDADQVVDATAVAYNANGDQATSTSSEFYLIDTSAGRVTVDPITGDNVVAGNEDQNVTISGSTTSIAPGQTVSVEVFDENGVSKYSGSATVGIDGKWSITGVDMSSWPDEANYQVVANATDSSGNPAFKGEQDFSTRVTQSDSLTIQENTVGTGNVLTNDSNPSHTLQVTSFTIAGDTQTYSAGQTATISGIGQIIVQADGSYQFTPEHNWDGTVPKITYNTNINEHDTLGISVEPAGSNHTGTVTIDPVTADNVINATESGSTVAVTGTASGGDIKAGDAVTLVINGTQYTTTVGSDGKWSASVSGSDLAIDSDKTFTAVVTSKDSSGGTVISNADHTYSVDTLAGSDNSAPTVTITEDANNDGVISSSELSGAIDVQIGIPAGALAGDTISVTDGTTTHDIVLSTSDLTAGHVTSSFTSPGEGNPIKVDAVLKDQYGNTSAKGTDSATVDTLAGSDNSAPTVTITEDANNDGVISSSELSGAIDVQIGIPAGALAGDTISVTDGTTTHDIVLSTSDLTAGHVTSSFTSPGEGNPIKVDAVLKDQYGNTSAKGTDSATVDTLAGSDNSAPTVTITEDANNDGVISSSELSGAIDVQIGIPAGALAGDTISVTDGTTTHDIVLSTSDLTAGHVTSSFTSPGEGNPIKVDAVLKDQYGNTSAKGTDSATVDTLAGSDNSAPTVTITEDANNDGVISSSELSGAIDVQIGIPAGALAGDTISVTDGTTTHDIVLSTSDLTAGHVTSSFTSPGEGNPIKVDAVLKDQYGNTSAKGTDSATVDTLAGSDNSAPTVTITEDANNDGVISSSELSGAIDVQIGIPAGALAGDTISVTDGTTTHDIVLSTSDLTAGHVTSSFTSPGEGNPIKVDAVLKDQYGNTSAKGTDSATVDTLAGSDNSAPTVTITEDANNDGVISSSELSGAIDVQIGIPAGALAGDTISVTDGTTTHDIVLSTSDLTAGHVTSSFTSPGEGNPIKVDAVLKDQYGNTSAKGTDSATVDTLAGSDNSAPTVTITEDANNDGVISSSELSGAIDVQIGIPAGALAGDTISVTDGTTTHDIVLSTSDLTAGHVTSSFTSPGEGNPIKVDAVLKDQYGNTSAKGTDSATVDTLAGSDNSAPTVTITEDANNDGVISSSELSGAIDVQIGIPAGALAGDTISVTDGTTTHDIVLSTSDLTAGHVTSSFTSPGEGNPIKVDAVLKDQYGNTSAKGTDSATVDTLAGSDNSAPTVTITEDANNDGVISSSELSGAIDVQIGIPAGALAGDTISVTDGTTTHDIVLSTSDLTAGHVTSSFTSPGEGNPIKVDAVLKDQYGNTSAKGTDSATVDTLAGSDNSAPTVTITEDANNDGVISSSELSGAIDVQIGIPAGALAGDTISVTDGTTTHDIVLSTSDLTAGHVTSSFTSPGEGNPIKVDAVLKDQYGNTSAKGTDSATVDTLAGSDNSAPTVTITEDANNDGVISSSELSGAIDVQIGIPAGALAGDTISVTDGTTTHDIVLSTSDLTAGHVTSSFTSPGEGNPIKVDAVLKDQYGNTSAKGTDSATVDTLAGSDNSAPTVTITEDANNDGVISSSELSGAIDVQIGIPAGALAGDTISVTDGTTTHDIVLSTSDLTAGHVTSSFTSPGEGNPIKVDAVLKDQYGNTSAKGTDSATVDTLAGSDNSAPTVTITEDANNDGVISSSELSGAIDVQIGIPAGALAGDTISVTDGTTTHDIVLSTSDLTAGHVTSSFTSPGEGNPIKVDAVLKDQYGNTSAKGTDSATVDTLAGSDNSAPTVTITEDANNDGVISSSELSGAIDVQIGIPAGALAGDTISVTDGTTTHDIVLSTSDLTAGHVTSSFTSPGEGNPIKVDAVLKDQYGNTSAKGTDSATVDTLAGSDNSAPTVTITEDANNDGVISSSELSGAIDVQIGIPAGALAGDTISVTDGTTTHDIVLSTSDLTAGHVTSSFTSPGEGNPIKVDAVLKDQYGNTSAKGTDSATVDTLAGSDNSAPTVTITEDANNDGVISSSELSGAIDVQIGIPAGALAGDTISVTDGTTTHDIVLSTSDLTAGHVTSSFTSPGEGNPIKVDAVLKDQYGNTSAKGTDSATVDTLAGSDNSAPTVTITEDANNDGVISSSELSGAIDVQIGIPAGALAGDTISVTDGTTTHDIVLSTSDLTAGHVTSSFTSPGEGNPIKVDAVLKDQYGNTSAKGTDSATVDTLAGSDNSAPTVTITEDANNDGVISSSELSGAIDVQIGIPAGALAGDTISVTDGTTTHDIVLSTSDLTAGHVTSSFTSPGEGNPIKVDAVLKDQYGNTSAKGTDSATVDTLAGSDNSAPTVTITEDANNDGVISSSELSGAIDVQIGIPAGALAGDTISVTDGTTTHDIVLSTSDLTAGHVTSSFTSPGEGNPIKVDAVLKDQYGNTSAKGTDSATVDTLAGSDNSAPTVTITEDANNDGVISSSELSGAIDVQIGIPAGALAGDTISVTDGTTTHDIVLSTSDLTAGHVTSSFTSPGEGNPIKVDAVLKDQYGNTSAKGTDSATVDTLAGSDNSAPTVTITEDANNDGVISSSELSGAIDVQIGIPAGALAGDTISVTDGTTTHDIVLSTSDLTAGHVTSSFTSPGEGNPIKVDAVLKDQYGNTSAKGTDSATVDTLAGSDNSAPTVTITEDANNDGVISSSELSGAIDVQIGIPAGALAGDTISVTDGTTTHDIVLSTSDLTAGHVTSSFTSPGEGNPIKVDAVLKDQYGNTSAKGTDSATVDTLAGSDNSAPTVTITEDANNDGVISSSELSGAIDVQIGIPAGALAGDTISVTDGTTTHDIVLSTSDLTAGHVTSSFTSPGEGNPIKVDAVLKDQYGNTSAKGTDSATVDTLAGSDNSAPTVTITEDANNDGVISSSELSGAIDVQIGIPAGALAGDTISVTDGTTTHDIVLSTSDLTAGHVTSSFTSPGEGNPIKVDAVLKDQYGNTSAKGTDSATVDTLAGSDNSAPTVTITEDANNDGVISSSELSGAIDVQIGIPAGALAGDTISVTDGTTTHDIVLSTSDLTAGHVTSSFTSPGEGNPIKVDAVLKDQYGNTSAKGTDSATVDTLAGSDNSAPTVTITEDANNDGVISSSELSGAIDVQIGIPAGALAGDTISVTDGTTTHDIVLSTSDLTAGHVTSSFTSPGEGNPIKVDAVLKDQYGNTSAKGTDSATVDTLAGSDNSAPTVTITEDANNDGVISSSELSGAIDVQIGIPAGALAGDTISVTDGTTTHDIVLSTSDLTAGHVTSSFTSPGEGNPIKVDAVLKDQYGNTSAKGTDSATVDTLAGSDNSAPTVTITEDANNDGVISSSELSGAIDVQIGIPAGALAGDTISVTDGTTTHDIVLSTSDLTAGHVTSSFTSPGEGNPIKVDAVLKDQYGNTSAKGTDSATVDTLAGSDNSAPTVTITEDANNDGVISSSELSGAIDVQIGIPAGALAGDTISVTDGTTTHDIVLSTSDLTAGHVTSSFTSPGEGNPIKVDAVLKDQYGNTSAKGTDSATVDTLAGSDNSAPTVTITEDANNDGVISSSELSGAIDVQIGIPAGALAGDTISVTDGTTTHDIVLSTSDLTAGHVTSSFTSPGEGNPIKVDAVLKDQYGNTSAKGTDSATVDTLAGSDNSAPTVTITEDANNDGVISSSELSGAIDVQIGIPAGALAGDTISVTDGTTTHDIVLSTSDLTAGHVTSSFTSPGEGNPIKVDAVLKDQYGNTSAKGTDSATVDTLAGSDNSAPTVTITEDANNDGVISSSELSGAIDVQIGIPAGALAGDTISVTDGTTTHDIVLSTSDLTAGHVTSSFTSPGEGNPIKVDAVLKDQYGNTSAKGTDSATVDTTATAGTVTINDVTSDNIINATESGQSIAVTGTATGGDISIGDTVTMTINGTDYTTTVGSDGSWSVNVAGSDLAADSDKGFTASVASTDVSGNPVTSTADHTYAVDIQAPDKPVITNITDTNGDYSNVILHGTGEPGATITLFSREGSTTGGNDTGSWTYTAVETGTPIVVDANGNWTVDVSNLPNTPIDDNEFFKATQTDVAGNVSTDSDSVHYWHGDWSAVNTETQDDYVMMGGGKDTINIISNDSNDKFVVDGGNGTDTAVFSGKFSEYALSTSSTGSLMVTEGASTDSDGNGVGDVDELRNIEKVKFNDGTYDVSTGVFTLNDINVDIEHDTGTSSSDRITNDSTLKVTGLVAGATLEYSVDGGQTWTSQYNPQEGTNNISVRQVDAEGHTSERSNVSFTLDTQAGANIDVDKITGDGYLTAAEASPGVKVPVTGYVQGDAQPGDTISIILDGKVIGTGTVSSDVNSNGAYTFSVDVLGSDLADGSGIIPELKATVTGSDIAGNTFNAETTEVYMKDFVATVSINVTDGNASDTDNVISASEATSAVVSGNVEVGGQVNSITISDGTNTLTIPANQITVYSNGYYTVNADVSSLNDGTLTVSVEASDKLGNVGTNSTNIEKDTQAQAGAVTVDSITDDNIVNTAEGGQTIAVTGTASGGDVSTGDAVTMTISGKEYTTKVASDGSWSVDVAGTDLFNDSDKSFTVSVASSDDAGNAVVSSTTHTYSVDRIPVSTDETQSMDFESDPVSQQTTNIVITLDISGSMDSEHRLTLAKSAIEKMIHTYDDQGTVNVKVVAFNDHGTVETKGGDVWLKADDAISMIKDLQAGGSTNYEDAVLKTYQNYSEPSADKTVAYFISDGAPTTENNDGWQGNLGLFDNIYRNGWNEFVKDHVNDLHVVALGDDAKDSQYLKDLASAGDNVSTVTEVSDASQLSDAIVPANTELSVSGTVSDNVTGGDGAITFQIIQVDGTTYTASNFPSEGVSIAGKGTLTFDFSTGNYTYTASSNEFTKDVTQAFTVTAADADGDTANVKVSFNVNVDDTASPATLNMSIGQSEVTTAHNYSYDSHEARNANQDHYNSLHDALEGQDGQNHSNGTLVYKNVNETSWNINDSSDKLFAITGNSHNANINLSGGDNTVIFEEDPGKNVSVNFGSGKDILMLPGSESDYDLSAFHNNGGVLSGQITGHDNMNLTVNNLECLVFSDQVMGDSSLYKGETSNHYDYDLKASASPTDTDGSESLSDVTISGLPSDGSVNVTGTGVTENSDGTYKVTLQDDGKIADDVKLSSSRELTSTELNDVHASVTSTESNGGATATTEVNESGDNFLYADTGDDLFVGTSHNDHFKVAGDDLTTIKNFDASHDVLDISDVIGDNQTVTSENLLQYLDVTKTDTGVEVKVDSNGSASGGDVANIMLEGLNDTHNLQIQIDDNKVEYND